MCCNKNYGCLYVRFGLNACTCIWLSWDQDNSWKITITHESCKIVRVSVYDAPLPLSSLTHASTDKEIDDFLACFFISLGKSTPPPPLKLTFGKDVFEIYMKSSVSSVFSVTRRVSVSCCEFSSHCSWFLLKLTERQSAWPIHSFKHCWYPVGLTALKLKPISLLPASTKLITNKSKRILKQIILDTLILKLSL